jgi:hypothetical protein
MYDHEHVASIRRTEHIELAKESSEGWKSEAGN